MRRRRARRSNPSSKRRRRTRARRSRRKNPHEVASDERHKGVRRETQRALTTPCSFSVAFAGSARSLRGKGGMQMTTAPITRGAGRAVQHDGPHAGRVHPRSVAAAEQLGPLGRGLRGGRLHGADARAGRTTPRPSTEANAHPEVFAHKTVGQVADHYAEVIAAAGHEAGGDRALLRRAARPDPRRARAVGGDGGDRSGAVPRRAAAADLGAASRPPGARQPRQPPPRGPAHLRPVPLRLRQRGRARTRPRSSTRSTPCRRRGAALPGGDRQPQPVDRGEGRQQEPRARAAADHLRREGPHRPLGDRERRRSSSRSATRA